MDTLPKRLSSALIESGLSRRELSDKTGLTQQQISRLLNGKTKGTTKIVQLARALGVRPAWLALGEEPQSWIGFGDSNPDSGPLFRADEHLRVASLEFMSACGDAVFEVAKSFGMHTTPGWIAKNALLVYRDATQRDRFNPDAWYVDLQDAKARFGRYLRMMYQIIDGPESRRKSLPDTIHKTNV